MKTYSISELATRLNMSTSTLKNYEEKFDLKIERNDRGHRRYTESDEKLFKLIIRIKNQGATLDVIKKILISKNIIQDKELKIKTTAEIKSESSNHLDIEIKKEIKNNVKLENENKREIINYNDLSLNKVVEKRYSVDEVTQLTATLKLIQDNYINDLKHQLEEKERQVSHYEEQIQKGHSIIEHMQKLISYEVEKNNNLENIIKTKEKLMIDVKKNPQNQGFFTKIKKIFLKKL